MYVYALLGDVMAVLMTFLQGWTRFFNHGALGLTIGLTVRSVSLA